uniref:Uncharacterized protein n=2 Tax=Stomoxys calcitrans TaxID=35570 RepID=A0A1I8QCJ1_STOCA
MPNKIYTQLKMPNLINQIYSGNGAISPELVETQPHLVKNVLKARRHSGKFRMFSMIIERTRPKSNTSELEDVEMPLDSSGQQNDLNSSFDEVCLLRDSPFRILRAAEAGNLDDFKRLYQADNTRLSLQDGKGRTAAHQAASRNRVNILRYIRDQNGDFNIRDNAGNTPIHVAVECDSFDALDYLLSIPVDTSILNEKKQAPVHL